MAILDKLTEFLDEFDLSSVGTAGTKNVGNTIPLSQARDIGNGKPVYLVVAVGATEIITGGSAGTLKIQLVSDDTETPDTGGTQTIHFVSRSIVTDDAAANDAYAAAGKVLMCIPLPLDGASPYESFLGLQAVIGTTTITAGTLNAWLSLDPVTVGARSYPDANN